MAEIRPFRALRPAENLASDVAALPYDVYNREEACAFVQDRPFSFLNIDRPETQFSPETDIYDPRVYEKADEMIREWTQKGIFIREDSPCLYIYALTMDGRTQTGLVACSSVDDYLNNIILKHENTRADKELDRINHVGVTSCQTGPIFLAYRDEKKITELIEKKKEEAPLYDFVSEDGIRHTVWVIGEKELIEELVTLFAALPHTYIADGHHRAASAVKVGKMRREAHPEADGTEEFNGFLSVLFPESELKILDYNRVVKDLNGLDEDTFLQKIGEAGFFTEVFSDKKVSKEAQPFKPGKKGEFGMYLSGVWYKLTAKPEILSADPVRGLDVSVLQDHLLSPVLGIEDPKTDKRIDFVGGIRGLRELERRVDGSENEAGEKLPGDMTLAFSMYPTAMNELFSVADAGLLMPPKSTWFEPKLRSGLFLHEIER